MTALIVLVLLSVACFAALCLVVWFVLALAAAIPWWVLIAYFGMKTVERSTHTLASTPKRVHFVHTRADARL